MAIEKEKELRLNTRASKEEVKRLDIAAQRLGISKAVIIRRAVNRTVDRIFKQLEGGTEPVDVQI